MNSVQLCNTFIKNVFIYFNRCRKIPESWQLHVTYLVFAAVCIFSEKYL